jgi:formate dehydrogenase major subunit
MTSVTIDGIKLQVPQHTTVLQAAEMAGIEIPTLCNHPAVTAYGGCRLCLVEVEGARALQPSCTLPVSNGMVVRTNTPQVREARRFILGMLFSERNHFCMYCQMSGGDCELQNAAYQEDMTHWPLQPNWQPYAVDGSHRHLVLDHNRCILCRRCVRACGELVGNFTLGMKERGFNTLLTADLDLPLGESTCVSCGTCIQVCPTGALIDKVGAYRGREADVEHINSICIGCSVGCGVELIVRDNHLVRIDGDWNAPINEGILCQIGRFLALNDDRERVETPMLRKNGTLEAATWDEALSYVADKLKSLNGKGSDGIAALASTRLPNEALYLFKQLFSDKLGSQMVTSVEEGITVAMAGQLAQAIGKPFEASLHALKSADCVIAIGVDLVENHQVAGFFVKRALPKGTTLIVIDPSDNGLHERADCTLRPKKGTDHNLLMGIILAIVNSGLAKQVPTDFSEWSDLTLEDISQTTRVDIQAIRQAAHLITSSQKPAFVYGKGITGQNSSLALELVVELARMVGAGDADGSAIIGTKGQANSLAAYMYGLDKPFEIDGHQAVYLALGDDKVSKRLLRRLESAPFLAVQASYVSPATAMADVVLPVEAWTEQQGHYLNLEGRLQQAHRGLIPLPTVWSNNKVLETIAASLRFALDRDWKKGLQSRVPTSTVGVR